MTKLHYWQIVSILLIGIILGYAGARIEFALTSDSIAEEGEEETVAEKPALPPPAPAVLNKEDQEILVDKDGSDPMLGNEDATVTIVEFTDYQCPYCKRYSTETFPQIKKNYIDTGKVKYYLRDFPLSFHPQAENAAKTVNCTKEQGKYWEMHDKLFANQSEWSGSPEAVQLFAKYAKEIGLDADKLQECTDKEETVTEILADFAAGSKLGVSGTPAFFINGEKLVGAQPYVKFEDAIEKALAD